MPGDPLQEFFVSDASRLLMDVDRVMRNRGKMSSLIKKGTLPTGVGFSYQTAVSTRSAITGGVTWTDVDAPNGTSNNCTPTITDMSWSTNVLNYNAQQALLRSDPICYADASKGYLFEQQVANNKKNLVDNIYEMWDDQDKLNYFTLAGHKIVTNAALTDFENATDFGATQATYKITQSVLDIVYTNLVQDGAGENPYAQANGAPLFSALMSMERSRDIIKEDESVRQDFRFAEENFGKEATLMKAWGINKAYGGFLHVIDNRMPRFNWDGSGYVPVPYWSNTSVTVGEASNVNPNYKTAQYEDIYIFHPDVVTRLTPPAPSSVGADTSFESIPYNGEIVWRNIPNADPNSSEFNPLGNIGRFWAQAVAAYRPNVVQYGIILRCRRCPTVTAAPCY